MNEHPLSEPWGSCHRRATAIYAHSPGAFFEKYLHVLEFQSELSGKLRSVEFGPAGGETLFHLFDPVALAPYLHEATRMATSLALSFGDDCSPESLSDYFLSAGDETEYPRDFVPRVVLQVWATLCRSTAHRTIETARDRCPHCGFPALLLALRPEGDGRKRFAVCSLCTAEWEAPRLDCIHCGEQQPARLPVFTFEQWTHIRVQACDNCQSFLKIVDVAADGHAIPVVDDIASPDVTFWAAEQSYRAASFNLLGV